MPSTASASVRARISVSSLARASSAALSLPHISCAPITALAVQVAAALGKILVFQLDHGGARALEGAHRALHVQRVAVAGVAVDDHRQRHAVGDARQHVGGFAGGGQAHVRAAELGVGHGTAGQVQRLEAGLLGQEGAERVIHAGGQQRARLAQAFAQRRHSGFAPVAATTLPQRSISLRTKRSNSCGPVPIGTRPSSASRSRILGRGQRGQRRVRQRVGLVARQACRSEQAVPGAVGEAREHLGHRRHLRERRQALRAGDGQRLELAALDQLLRRGDAGKRQVDLAGHHVGQRRAGALVRHAHDVQARLALEHLAGQVVGAADAGDRQMLSLPGSRLGQRDELAACRWP